MSTTTTLSQQALEARVALAAAATARQRTHHFGATVPAPRQRLDIAAATAGAAGRVTYMFGGDPDGR